MGFERKEPQHGPVSQGLDASAQALGRELRSFGRRRGRTLSGRQKKLLETVLPRVLLDLGTAPPGDLTGAFARPVTSVQLEIGFGAAEHLVWQAQQNPEIGFIGCEPYVDGVVKALDAIEEHGLSNVRLYDDDVRDVLRWLEPACLERAFILFPDPWPKVRQRKRRLVNPQLFEMLARGMAPGATLLIATDIGDYARTILSAARSCRETFAWQALGPDDWRVRPGAWPHTRYEQKASREGRVPYFFTFIRRGCGEIGGG